MTGGPSAAPKRSLFKKPTWAAERSAVAEIETNSFGHRDSTYSAIVAERQKKRLKHRTKAVPQAESWDGGDAKRRRLSEDDDETDSDIKSSDSGEKTQLESPEQKGPVTRSTPTKKGRTTNPDLDRLEKHSSPVEAFKASPTRVFSVEDEKATALKPRGSAPLSDPESESEEEDDYTLELKRKAREKARLRKLGLDPSRSKTPEPETANRHPPQFGGLSQSDAIKSPEASVQRTPPPRSPSQKEDDVKVMILIRTAIPNTNQLIVNRWASQTLRQVKEAWCKRQGFDAAMARKVFLTWRGNRLFNTSTLTHILRTLRAEGKRSEVGNLDSDEEASDPSQAKIEVEAITEDILAERKRLKERDHGLEDASTGDDWLPPEGAGQSGLQKEPDVQLMLNSPGLESVALRVRPTTLVSKIMAGFKKIRQVDQGKTCWLIFDGERLGPETRICDTEIEDGDVVDVQIR